MKNIQIVFGIFALIQLIKDSKSILNGDTLTNLTEFPSIVFLVTSNSRGTYLGHKCGAALVSPEYVLTAAHCVYDRSLASYLVVGNRTTLNQNLKDRNIVSSKIEQLTIHPDYNDTYKLNDIAVIKLKTPLPLSEYVKPAIIANTTPEVNTECQVAGFGYKSYDAYDISNKLQIIKIPIVSHYRCQINFIPLGSEIIDSQLCAGYVSGMKDSCDGDSGGPLVCEGKLNGVVSAGVLCGLGPGIYTDIAQFYPWIMNVTNFLGSKESSTEFSISSELNREEISGKLI